MRDIHWNQLSTFDKIIFILGCFAIVHPVFWVALFVVYAVGRDRGRQYRDVFNPHTLKVPYVFGWINFVLILLCLLFLIGMIMIGLTFAGMMLRL